MVHNSIEPNELWHRRLAHVHYRALPLASKVVEGLPEIQQSMKAFAKDVRRERTQRRNLQVEKSKAKGILEIIHSDVCGPMSSSSLSGYVYYVSLIDDFVGRHGYIS